MIRAAFLVPGEASGPVVSLDEPLSFWGGFDPETGRVIDRRHPQLGRSLTGAVLLMPTGRGSSSSSNVVAEAIRLHTAPAAVLMSGADSIIALGAMVAEELYGLTMPVATIDHHQAAVVRGWSRARLEPDGEISET
jgi:predicted aconitase with swiveling domain